MDKKGENCMKKTIVSISVVLIILLNIIQIPVIAENTYSSVLNVGDLIAAEVGGTATDSGTEIVQNDKYVCVVEGVTVGAFSNDDIHVSDKIHIYEKPNNEHLEYKYLTTVKQTSNSTSRGLPARNVWINDNLLYVSWGNAQYAKDTTGNYASDGKVSPLKVYNLEDLEAGDVPSEVLVGQNFEQRAKTHAPFIRGAISYLDKEEGLLYASGVMNSSYARKEYRIYNTEDISDMIATGEETVAPSKTFSVEALDKNTVKFIVKDGFIYEILQQKAGLIDFSGDNTLVDADGNVMNNTVHIYDLESSLSTLNNATDGTGFKSIADYKRGVYTTETAGDIVINDIAVSDSYMYLATVNGLEVIDISSAKSEADVSNLVIEAKLLDGEKINAVEVTGNTLYVGADNKLVVYSISEGIPQLTNSFDFEGGFKDFEINEEENLLYALSNSASGGAVIISLDTLFGGLNVSDFKFIQDSENTDVIKEGELSFSATAQNNTGKAVDFDVLFALYKGNKLLDVKIDDYSLAVAESKVISSSVNVDKVDGLSAKVFFLNGDKLIPMITENGIEFEKEIGTTFISESQSDLSVEISDMDDLGEVSVSGTIPEAKNKPILIVAKKASEDETDRLENYRFIDIVTADENGKYSAAIMPSDSGEYDIEVRKVSGAGVIVDSLNVPNITVALQNTVEVPGIQSFLFIEFENGQNINTIDVEVTFDGDIISADENVTASEEFSVSSVISEEGKVSVKLTKKEDSVLTTAKNEFCIIPVKIAETAEIGEYQMVLDVTAMDEFSAELETVLTNGTIDIQESTPKYEALENAVKALKALKKAEQITADDYLTEKDKATYAREQVNIAYEYFIRDSQLGVDLVNNLNAVDEKILELKPYYDAVDSLNSAEQDDIDSVLKENKQYFELPDEAITIYDKLSDKTEIKEIIMNEAFEKPSDVYKTFMEALVLSAFDETRWQNVATLLEFAENASELDLSSYNKLNSEQKAVVHQDLALREYENISDLQNALDSAVEEAKEIGSTSSRPSGSGSGSKGSGSKGTLVYLPNEPVVTPSQPDTEVKYEGFTDIASYGWAKDAIDYLFEKGVINGKTAEIFAPADNVTREEFAKIVALAFDIRGGESETSFKDVDDAAWYSKYIYALAEKEIINGRPDGTFGVGDYITREEIAVILDRVTAIKGLKITADENVDFNDSENISDYAAYSVNRISSAGIISGFPDGTIKPRDLASRAQAAQLIYKAIKIIK